MFICTDGNVLMQRDSECVCVLTSCECQSECVLQMQTQVRESNNALKCLAEVESVSLCWQLLRIHRQGSLSGPVVMILAARLLILFFSCCFLHSAFLFIMDSERVPPLLSVDVHYYCSADTVWRELYSLIFLLQLWWEEDET